jgi:Trp operon repressor
MSRKSSTLDKDKLQQITDLLKFILTLDDQEVVKNTIEAIIELLEEEINKK